MDQFSKQLSLNQASKKERNRQDFWTELSFLVSFFYNFDWNNSLFYKYRSIGQIPKIETNWWPTNNQSPPRRIHYPRRWRGKWVLHNWIRLSWMHKITCHRRQELLRPRTRSDDRWTLRRTRLDQQREEIPKRSGAIPWMQGAEASQRYVHKNPWVNWREFEEGLR